MPAIGGVDDLYARVLSGLVQLGIPDGTRAGAALEAQGAFNVENLLQMPTAGEGILLVFPGLPGVEPPEYPYSLRVVRAPAAGPGGFGIEARCAETLFHHVWPTANAEQAAGAVVESLRTHHRAFLDWRARGGEVSYGERLGVPALPVEPVSPGLVRFLAGLYKSGHSVTEGPAKGWWAPATVWAGQITTGAGVDPMYQIGPREVPLSYDEREHQDALRGTGWAMALYGAVCALWVVGYTGWQSWQWWLSGSMPFWQFATVVGTFLSGGLWLGASQILIRGPRRWFPKNQRFALGVVLAVAVFGMTPCSGFCCLGGVLLGGWTLIQLHDDRTRRVL